MRSESICVRLDGKSIQYNVEYNTKFLGINIHSLLRWSYHVTKKMSGCYYAILNIRDKVHVDMQKMFYCAYVHSTLKHG